MEETYLMVDEKYFDDIRRCRRIALNREHSRGSDSQAILLDDKLDEFIEKKSNPSNEQSELLNFLNSISNESILMIAIVMEVGKSDESEELIKERGIEGVYQLHYDSCYDNEHLKYQVESKMPLGTYLSKGMQLLKIPIVDI